MVQVNTQSITIKHRSGLGKSARDSYHISITYTPNDVKKFLQEYLKELRLYDMPNKFTERELIELFATRVFSAIPYNDALDIGAWAFDISIRRNFITSNRWNKDEQTIYFIDRQEMSIRRGRPGKRKIETYENES